MSSTKEYVSLREYVKRRKAEKRAVNPLKRKKQQNPVIEVFEWIGDHFWSIFWIVWLLSLLVNHH